MRARRTRSRECAPTHPAKLPTPHPQPPPAWEMTRPAQRQTWSKGCAPTHPMKHMRLGPPTQPPLPPAAWRQAKAQVPCLTCVLKFNYWYEIILSCVVLSVQQPSRQRKELKVPVAQKWPQTRQQLAWSPPPRAGPSLLSPSLHQPLDPQYQ